MNFTPVHYILIPPYNCGGGLFIYLVYCSTVEAIHVTIGFSFTYISAALVVYSFTDKVIILRMCCKPFIVLLVICNDPCCTCADLMYLSYLWQSHKWKIYGSFSFSFCLSHSHILAPSKTRLVYFLTYDILWHFLSFCYLLTFTSVSLQLPVPVPICPSIIISHFQPSAEPRGPTKSSQI